MNLIDFLISENKKGWEWPDSIVNATSTKGGRSVNFYFDYACHPSLSNTLIAPTPFFSSELVTREKYEAALAAIKPEWDGDGLPPVGCECEIVDKDGLLRYGHGESGEVIAHIENTAVIRMSYGLGCFNAGFLRPIRSEEEKKRDEAVKALRDIISGPGGPYAEVKAGEIYDAIKSGKIVID
ncbi:hypothetical protein LWT57_12470 [Enterobacter cloacae]|uniref:hypothetical protein n=1 Tax=Enterobacter cloacae TaxID=550 RepID=UPI001E3276FD|nr:hypothetical protein [Enterobacter cloacae]MCE1970827.1 hypothetical protein [Enterobacter cloacae]